MKKSCGQHDFFRSKAIIAKKLLFLEHAFQKSKHISRMELQI